MAEKPITESELTFKQERFCSEYVANGGNATEAAKNAGYEGTYESIRTIGWENLTKLDIVKRINELREQLNIKGIVSKEWVTARLREVAERSLQVQSVTDEEGNVIGEFKYDSSGANKALDLLGKTLGIYVEKTEITGKDGEKLQTVIYLPSNDREKES